MSLFRFLSISVLAIAIAVLVASNLADALPLIFLTVRTIPIPLGLLALAAGSTGILAGVWLRLLATSPRRERTAKRRAERPEFEPEPIEESFRPSDREAVPRENRSFREPEFAEEIEDRKAPSADRQNSTIYDANYRVINAPKNSATPAPQVNSRLRPDNEEDWGFDFDEED